MSYHELGPDGKGFYVIYLHDPRLKKNLSILLDPRGEPEKAKLLWARLLASFK